MVREMIRTLGLRPGDSAIDGTVIESAASRFNMLKQEAAREAAATAAQTAAEEPENTLAQRDAERAKQLVDAVAARTEARAEKGKPADFVRAAVTDPEAVNQPRKDGVVRPSYKPSVLAHETQLIIAQHLDPSSEIAAIEPMLAKHNAVFAAPPNALLLDAGYHASQVIVLAVEQEINLLCPSGKTTTVQNWERASSGKAKFAKHLFVFQPDEDAFRCPSGKMLNVIAGERVDRDGRRFVTYGGADCARCELAKHCTTAASGRTVKRYDGDELKEALATVMKHPAARARYKRRSVIVEPVFAGLRALGLQRFRRRGVRRVRAEFALYCIAYNVWRADGICEARALAFACIRIHGPIPTLVVIGIVISAHPRW
jgi:hypothetical protein